MDKINSVKLIAKRALFILLSLVILSQIASAQKILPADLKKLHVKEDSLQALAENLIMDSLTAGRMRSDSQFVKTLIRSLQVRNSFYYPFDSVQGISKLYAPDSTFRIFTWALSFDVYYSRQRGAIQLRTSDGSLKLIPLRDFSEFTQFPLDSVRTKNNWIGAVYYNIVETKYNGKNFYTLFGYDDNSVLSNKKWIEVLTFNENHEPVFGGPFFSYKKDSVHKSIEYRFSIEYKKEARILANYVDEVNMILVDHLISETDEPENKWTYIPDGDYEAFKWENGKWLYVDKAFDYKIDMKGVDPLLGKPPMEVPIYDARGNRIEPKPVKPKVKPPGD